MGKFIRVIKGLTVLSDHKQDVTDLSFPFQIFYSSLYTEKTVLLQGV